MSPHLRPSLGRRIVLGAGLGAVLGACSSEDATTPSAEPSAPPTPSQAPSTPAAPVGRFTVKVRKRESWQAADPIDEGIPQRIRFITVHHSSYMLRDNAGAVAQMQKIQREHQTNLWPDIAYHYLVDLEGTIYQGRDPATRGDSFTPVELQDHLLVCLLGHFDRQPFGDAQRAGLERILAGAVHEYDVPTDVIAGHDDRTSTTTCPGQPVTDVIRDGSLTAAVDTMLAASTPRLRLVA